MVELLLIVPVVWLLLLTWGVGNLYTRPKDGLKDEEVELLKRFIESLQRLAAKERRARKS